MSTMTINGRAATLPDDPDAVSWRMLGVPVIPIRGRNRYEFPRQGA